MSWNELIEKLEYLEKVEMEIFLELKTGDVKRLEKYAKVLLEKHSLQAVVLVTELGASGSVIHDLLNMPLRDRDYLKMAKSRSGF